MSSETMQLLQQTKSTSSSSTSTTSTIGTSTNGIFVNYCSLTQQEMKLMCHDETIRRQHFITVSNVNDNDDDTTSKTSTLIISTIQEQQKLTLIEELIAIIVLTIGPPNGVFSIPLLTILFGHVLFGYTIKTSFYYLFLYILVPLTLLPQSFVSSTLTSYIGTCIIKYFSFRIITYDNETNNTVTTTSKQDNDTKEKQQKQQRPQIFVAPPHGVFPYGNILALLAWPAVFGTEFRGLAANAALRVPIFKQLLKSIGVIDASRSSATSALSKYPFSIGISTGGVAEVFETHPATGDECIVLKERIGLIKLAIRTGADIVPCYLFGNTYLLSCWAGEGIPNGRNILEKISRRIGFALIIFYGRWYLPIPCRIPILAVRGKPIGTYHYNCPNEPTQEQITTIQQQLITDMQLLFDTNKKYYGWDTSHLLIK